ncbi:uncharacterized protein [Halyomorpha halys]|uniref:uncharacterized protein n=1 Tax=Halyomorpha halys TaxID=286706 RepID=UPI0006D4FF12|nr:uncharacterized protein LOC106688893 [Halyomorpha halys]
MRLRTVVFHFFFLTTICVASGDELPKTETTITSTKSVSEKLVTPVKETIDVTKAYNKTTGEETTLATSTTPYSTIVTSSETEATTENLVTTSENAVTTPENLVTTVSTETTTETEFIDILGSFDNEEDSKTSTTTSSTTNESPREAPMNKTMRMDKLSDQIRAVIRHYKKHGTVTIPDASVPDPMSLPNMKKSFSGLDMTFTNQKVYGLSNYTIEHVNTDLDKMQVYVAVYMNKLTILGNYTANTWFKKVAGPFNVTLQFVEASGAAALIRDLQGNLQASDSEMDMTFMDSRVKFGNMGVMGSLLQGVVASAGPVLFDAVKPVILKEINERVREDVNKKIKTIGSRFAETGSTPPLEVAIQEARKYVKENGYDPYKLDNYGVKYMPTNDSIFQVNISNLVLTGLSDFRRVGEVSLSMDSGTIQIGLHLATSKLKGRCTWSVTIGKAFKRIGHTNFTVDYVQGRGIINQSLNVSQHPTLEDIDINVGKVKVQMKGTGPFDILVEAFVNTLPDLIRHIVVDAIELPLKFALQHMLSEVDVQQVLNKQLPELDKMGL